MIWLLVMLSICKVVAEVAILAKSRRYFVEVGWAERRQRQGQRQVSSHAGRGNDGGRDTYLELVYRVHASE